VASVSATEFMKKDFKHQMELCDRIYRSPELRLDEEERYQWRRLHKEMSMQRVKGSKRVNTRVHRKLSSTFRLCLDFRATNRVLESRSSDPFYLSLRQMNQRFFVLTFWAVSREMLQHRFLRNYLSQG
jgi:hypothetical protein